MQLNESLKQGENGQVSNNGQISNVIQRASEIHQNLKKVTMREHHEVYLWTGKNMPQNSFSWGIVPLRPT